jgi:hypothetical protein
MNRSPEVELYLRLGLGVGWIAKVVLMGLDIPEIGGIRDENLVRPVQSRHLRVLSIAMLAIELSRV